MMHLSPFFEHLHQAYEAELADMRLDSEGRVVLQQRLTQRRAQLATLLPLMELSPEMVATVFHGAFTFSESRVLIDLVACEPEALPPWPQLEASMALQAWAQPLAAQVLQQHAGDTFLGVAAALEFLHQHDAHHHGSVALAPANEVDGDADEHDSPDLEEAGAAWLAEQGFDHKE